MQIDIPSFTIQIWHVLYLTTGSGVAVVAFILDAFQSGVGNAFGYPSKPLGILFLAAIVLFWPVIILGMIIGFMVTAWRER